MKSLLLLKRMLALLFSIWLFFAGVSCQGPSEPDAGGVEFVMNLVSPIYMCPDELSLNFVDTSKVETVRYNESCAFMTGSITFTASFDHSTMIEIIVDKEANGRYEMVMTHEICDVCAEIENPESNYGDYIKYFGLPEKCPFEPGEYPIHDLIADTQDIPCNSANVGMYQVTMNFYNNPSGDCTGDRNFLACMKLDAAIEST